MTEFDELGKGVTGTIRDRIFALNLHRLLQGVTPLGDCRVEFKKTRKLLWAKSGLLVTWTGTQAIQAVSTDFMDILLPII